MMSEVWEFLDSEYGKEDEIAVNQIRDLHKFLLSKVAHTDSQKFHELYTIWRDIYGDLGKIKLTSQLNNPHALWEFLSKFPNVCQNSYINYKALPANVDKRLDIVLNDWLKGE